VMGYIKVEVGFQWPQRNDYVALDITKVFLSWAWLN
jgi:hypothetical protein